MSETSGTRAQKVKNMLLSLDATELDKAKQQTAGIERREVKLENVKELLKDLTPDQLCEIKIHVLQLQNAQSDLLRLPPELRVIIYDWLALVEWRSTNTKSLQTCSILFRFESLNGLGSTCQQLRIEYGSTGDHLARLGITMEYYDIPNKTWKYISASECAGMRSFGIWNRVWNTLEGARKMVTGVLGNDDESLSRNGVIYFTFEVDTLARVFVCRVR